MKITKQTLIDYFLITLGVFLLGFAIIVFWQPHNLVTGGVSGLAIIVFYYTESAGFDIPIPIWLTTLVLNLPLFALGYKIVPKDYFVRSIYGYLMLVVATYVLRYVPPLYTDMLMGAIFGGVVCGIGVGFVFRTRATTGGSTLISIMLQRWLLRHISVAKILFVVDSTIILVGLIMFGLNTTMFAIVAVYVSSKVTVAVIEGFSFAKAVYIISQESEAIADKIMNKLERGVTKIPSKGGFTEAEQNLLLCVVPAKGIVDLKELVYSIDKKAFVIVSDVREVLGEGFTPGSQN